MCFRKQIWHKTVSLCFDDAIIDAMCQQCMYRCDRMCMDYTAGCDPVVNEVQRSSVKNQFESLKV